MTRKRNKGYIKVGPEILEVTDFQFHPNGDIVNNRGYQVGEVVSVSGNETAVFTIKRFINEPVAELEDLRADGSPDWTPIYIPVRRIIRVPQYTGDELWQRVTILIAKEVGGINQDRVPDDEDLKSIRSHCYRLLGGNGIKIVQDIKDRVRSIIEMVLET